jgi:hypothetical protein
MTADVLRSDVRHLILWLSKQPFMLINGLLCLRTAQSRRVGFFNQRLDLSRRDESESRLLL